MTKSPVKKKSATDDQERNANSPVSPLEHAFRSLIQLYGVATIDTLDPAILHHYFRDGFGKNKDQVSEYGVWLKLVGQMGKPMTETQIRNSQPFVTTKGIGSLLLKMWKKKGLLNKSGRNFTLALRPQHDYALIAEAVKRLIPLLEQMLAACRNYLAEFDSVKRGDDDDARHKK
jgi:hypothetical protein